MADDYGPGIKRLNYYHGQFLQKDDFNDEQGYHKEMRYRHNAHLHTSGVVYGLIVTQTSDTEIEVSPGMALDSRGREIVRLEAKTKQINAPGDYTKYVVIEFDQKKTDQPVDPINPDDDFNRWIELAPVTILDAPPSTPGDPVLLAVVHVVGGIIDRIDNGTHPHQRRVSGAAGSLTIRDPQINENSWVRFSLEAPLKVLLEGSVRMTNHLGTNNYDPDNGYPDGWGGGVHTWDVYAEGTVGIGSEGSKEVWFNNTGNGFFSGGLEVRGMLLGGSLELGPPQGVNNETPFIDFHFGNGQQEDFNVRLINFGNKKLGFQTRGDYNAMTIDHDSVGIGVDEPSKKLHVSGSSLMTGNIGTHGYDPDSGYPPNWDGGVHTWDMYAEGSIAAGKSGNIESFMNAAGNGFFSGGLEVRGMILGGSLELGPSQGTNQETPFIDFHFGNGQQEDFNVRLINFGDKKLGFQTRGDYNVMTINRDRVGMGTDNPGAPLQISGNLDPQQNDASMKGILHIGGENDVFDNQYLVFPNPSTKDENDMFWWSSDMVFGRKKNDFIWAFKETHGGNGGSELKTIIHAGILDEAGRSRLGKLVLAPEGGSVGIGTSTPGTLNSIFEIVDVERNKTWGCVIQSRNGLLVMPIIAEEYDSSGLTVAAVKDTEISGSIKGGNFSVNVKSEKSVYGIYSICVNSGIGDAYAGYFIGDVYVSGSLEKSGGGFLIDHPLDPENKVLRHNFVESPEHLCLYRGRVKLNKDGKAIIKMPDYFAALTKAEDSTVNLTPIGKQPFPASYTWNSKHTGLSIWGIPEGEVAYIVLANRNDPTINKIKQPVEAEKSPRDKGKYYCPAAYGKDRKLSIHADVNDPAVGVTGID